MSLRAWILPPASKQYERDTQNLQQLTVEVADLRARLAEANETLRAIRSGEVDAVLVRAQSGDKLLRFKARMIPIGCSSRK